LQVRWIQFLKHLTITELLKSVFAFSPFVRYHGGMDKGKENAALLIAACIIAAIRLRGEAVKPSPRLTSIIHDSVSLARLVLAQIQK